MKFWLMSVLLLAVGCVYVWSEYHRRDEIDRLRGTIATVQHDLGNTDRAVAWTSDLTRRIALDKDRYSTAPSAPASASAPSEISHPDEPRVETSPALDAATLRMHLAANFDHQTADTAWSILAGQQLEAKFAALMPPNSSLKSVECRKTMCRIEMLYDDIAQYQVVLRHITPDALPWNGSLFSMMLSSSDEGHVGPTTFVAFLSREGQPLPLE